MWEKIKNILSKEGGKCIIVENDQPSYIVMKLEDYDIDEVNRSVDHWKSTEEKEEVKVEDLPF